MKLSRFVVVIPEFPYRDYCTLFSTLTTAVVTIPHRLFANIHFGKSHINRMDHAILYRCGMLLEDGMDENLLYRFWSCQNRYRDSTLAITLIMTYDCNSACKYCYEVNVRSAKSLKGFDNKMSDKVMRWINNYMDTNHNITHLDLCFHGGEPLLEYKQVEYIGTNIKKTCEIKRIQSFFSMVTNATLLTPEVAEVIAGAGVQFAIITLDGPKAIHDYRRPLLSGEGTFDIVLSHIKQSCEMLKIYLLVNIDKHNYESVPDLSRLLCEHGLNEKLHGVYVAFIEPTRPPTEHFRTFELPLSKLGHYTAEANKAFIEQGFKVREVLQLGFCSMNKHNSFIIDPYGDIYKCITGVGEDHFRIGNISDHLNILAMKSSQFVENQPCECNPSCATCTYLPMCKGGCRHESYVRFGQMTKGICMRDYFENMIPEAIKQIYPFLSNGNTKERESIWAARL